MSKPYRGEVWKANLSPTQGREQKGERPCLIISDDELNHGRADLVIAIPITKTLSGNPFHVEVVPPEGGLTYRSEIMCEQIRAVSLERLVHLYGSVSAHTLSEVADRLRILLSF